MRLQLGLVCVFLTLTVVLAQISFAMPDRHERNRCRPPTCVPKRNSGKKIADDEVRIEENALKLESTTTTITTGRSTTESENIKENENVLNGDSSSSLSPSPTPSKIEVVPLNVITSEPDLRDQNNTDSSSSSTPSNLEVVTLNVITPVSETGNQTGSGVSATSTTTTASPGVENGTGEIHIPVEVKIIPPSRDELGGLTGHCPKPFKYHNETGMCFIPGKGDHPCGDKMEFVEEPGTVFGFCTCKSYDGCDFRPLLHYPSAKGCSHAFEQGPCQSGEWLIPGPSFVPACVKRSCPIGANNTTKWITVDGKCQELGKQGFCTNPLEMLQYEEGKLTPTCSLALIKPIACLTHRTIILGASALPCGPGQKSTGSGGCGTLVEF